MENADIVVLSIDFRNAPEAPYPASLQDINYGIRWLKAHSAPVRQQHRAESGLYGTSSGGHQMLLAAIQPGRSALRALRCRRRRNGCQARLRRLGWGVLFPSSAISWPRRKGDEKLATGHDIFFGSEETQIEATPGPDRSSAVKRFILPPALVYQGTRISGPRSNWRNASPPTIAAPVARLDLAALSGAHHTFPHEHPFEPNSVKALQMTKAFHQTARLGAARAALIARRHHE